MKSGRHAGRSASVWHAPRAAAVGVVLVAVIVGDARGGTVLFELPDGRSSGNNSFSVDHAFVAQDFELPRDASVQGLVFSAFTSDVTVPITAVHVRFYRHDGGRVGDGIYSAVRPPVSEVVLGPADDDAYTIRQFTVDLPDARLAAGRYWMGLRADPAQIDLHWTISEGHFGNDGFVGDAEGSPASFEPYDFEHFFRLTGTETGTAVPLPASLWPALATSVLAWRLRPRTG